MTDRIDAIVAHPLVLPVQIKDPRAVRDGIRVRLDDGQPVPAAAYFVWTTSSGSGSGSGWTKDTPRWSVIDADRFTKSPPTTPGTWIAMIDLPIDAVGQGIWIDETRYEPNWLPSPLRVILETSARANDGFWDPALSESQSQSPLVLRALNNLRADPFNRWRAKLMMEGFNPDLNQTSTPAQTDRDLSAIHTELLQSDRSQVLDEIADHFTARWQIILGRIWLIDPQAAQRLKHQLTRTATAQSSTRSIIVPLWTDDTAELSALAHDLLSPFVNDELRVERVLAWLDAQPHSMSWIIDDSGHPTRNYSDGGSDELLLEPRIGMLSLHDQDAQPSAGLARIQSPGIQPSVQTLPPDLLTETTMVAPTQATVSTGVVDQPREVSVQIGRSRMTLSSMGDIPLALPPGVLVGPTLNDWTLHAFGSRQSGLGALPEPERRVAGLVHRIARLDEPDPRVGWKLYLEAAIDPNSDADTTLGIWIGTMDATRAQWTISRTLGLTEMRTDPDLPADPELNSVVEGDRWIIELQIPPGAITDDGFLILGIDRRDGEARSSWPRRMMPWQDEPGRFVIDTTAWDGAD